MSAIKDGLARATGATLRFDLIDARAKEQGISKGRLAELVGVDQSTLWRYRQGMRPTHDVLTRLRDALGLSLDEMTATGQADTAPPTVGD